MNDDEELTPQQAIEHICAAMVPFICERTGMQRRQVEKVLNAWHEFWVTRPKQLEVLWQFMHDDADD